jgi:hypothetical protein
MRFFAPSLALLSLAAPVMAQEQGSFALDAMTTAGRHVGFGYYITDALSLRPSLGFGYSSQFGTEFNLGADLRYEFLRDRLITPYITAGFNYMRNPYLVEVDASGTPVSSTESNVARYGAGFGLRARLKYGLSLVGEGWVMNSSLQTLPGYYGQQTVQNGAHFEAAVGISYLFH